MDTGPRNLQKTRYTTSYMGKIYESIAENVEQ